MQAFGGALSGEHQHGRMIHVGIRHPGNQVGGARPQRAQTTGGVAGEATVNFRHEGRALFVPRQNELDFVGLLQRNHEIGVFLAGHAEDIFDAFFFEAFYKQVGSFHRDPSFVICCSGQ